MAVRSLRCHPATSLKGPHFNSTTTLEIWDASFFLKKKHPFIARWAMEAYVKRRSS
jgi:hypothetical protein